MQIIGAEKFGKEDWACYETFTTGENLYVWREGGDWEKALETAAINLKKYDDIGIGFVDGDIEIT